MLLKRDNVPALAVRGMVAIGPAAPDVMQFGVDFAEGFALEGPPPPSFGGAAGFTAGGAFNYLKSLFHGGD